MRIAFGLIVMLAFIAERLGIIRAMNEDLTEMDADYDALRRG